MNEDKLDKAIRDIEQAKSMSGGERFIKIMPRKKYIPLHLISIAIWLLLGSYFPVPYQMSSSQLLASFVVNILCGAWLCALTYYRALDAGRGKGRYWAFTLLIPFASRCGLIYSFYLYLKPSRPQREWDDEKSQWR